MALRLLLKVAFLIFATNGAALSAEQLEELCPHPKGWKPTNEQLAHILVTHANWLEKLAEVPEEEILQKFVKGGRGRAGRVDPSDGTGRANLCNADLRGVQFDKRILRNAMLNGINLANEHLSDFDFGSVDLNDADLSGAKLSGTKFNRAELKRANLNEAELNNAHFFLSELEGANFSFAKLNSAGFEFSGLENVDMRDTELKNAGLFAVTLKGAQLAFTKLDEASLLALTLENARLLQVSVAGAHFSTIDFTNMDYSSRSAAPASVTGRITGLSTVTFDPGEEIGLVQLRDLLQKSGLRDYERQATYAIENGKTRHAIDDLHENPSAAAEAFFRKFAFDWTTRYGMEPARALLILIIVWVSLIPIYAWIIWRKPVHTNGGIGIYRVLPKDRLEFHGGEPYLDSAAQIKRLHARGLPVVAWSAYFSLLSAFQIGFREFSVGNWLTRTQPRSFTLEATGWVRTVSGVQSLLSVYLLAMWLLTYFGRPFQ